MYTVIKKEDKDRYAVIKEDKDSYENFPNFIGKIERGTADDFKASNHIVTEKMDGSYFQFGWYNGEFRYRSKGALDSDGLKDNKMFSNLIKKLSANKDLFKRSDGQEIIYCCEYLKSKKHNAILYDFENEGINLFLIDAISARTRESVLYCSTCFYSFPEVEGVSCRQVPVLIPGQIEELNENPFIESSSAYGKVREGVVTVRKDGVRFKFLSPAFQEVISKNKMDKRRSRREVDYVFSSYVDGLPARVDKSIFTLKEGGVDFTKDVFGRIISNTVKDLILEEKEKIKEDLFNFYERSFKKTINKKIIEIILERYSDCGGLSDG